MSPADRALLRLINARVARLQPDMAAAYRRTIALLAERVGSAEAVRLIESGRIDSILDEEAINRAMVPLRAQLRETLAEGFRLTLPDIPKAIVRGTPSIFFDVLSPRIVDAVRTMESTALNTIRDSARGTVRQVVERGLALGQHPTAIARDLRTVIGLAKNQEAYIHNFERQLKAGDLAALDRKLLNKRTAESLRKIIESGKPIPAARIEAAVAQYRKAFTAHNADTNVRQAALDAYRTARTAAYQSAIDRGIIPADRAYQRWLHFEPQPNGRPEHIALNGTEVPFGTQFPNGQIIPGYADWNCRCSAVFFVRPLPRI